MVSGNSTSELVLKFSQIQLVYWCAVQPVIFVLAIDITGFIYNSFHVGPSHRYTLELSVEGGGKRAGYSMHPQSLFPQVMHNRTASHNCLPGTHLARVNPVLHGLHSRGTFRHNPTASTGLRCCVQVIQRTGQRQAVLLLSCRNHIYVVRVPGFTPDIRSHPPLSLRSSNASSDRSRLSPPHPSACHIPRRLWPLLKQLKLARIITFLTCIDMIGW